MKVKPKNRARRDRQKGQFILEGVLLMVIILGIAMALQKVFEDGNYIGKLAAGPWNSIQKMMEQGSWDKSLSDGEAHPLSRTTSREGDTQ